MTRQRVLEIVRREGYRPNLTARGLARGRSNVIAAVIPVGFENVLSDPYFPSLLQGMASAADANDHFLMLSLGEPDFRHTVDEIARQGVVAGVIFSASQVKDPLLERLVATGTPVVSVGRPYDDQISYVDIDNLGSARQMTNQLLRLGYRRVALIAGPSYALAAVDRTNGYIAALESFGLRVDEDLVYEGDFSEASGRAGMKALLEHGPDAVFAASDRMASGAVNEIRAAGLRVPEDLALVGFDDMPLAAEMEPPLTTVRQRPHQLGAAAAALLLDLLADPAGSPKRVILPTELIVRASCGSHLNQETLSR